MLSQSSVKREENVPYINNLCAILLLLTVAGNYIDLCTKGSGVTQSLFLFIYSFHMPLLMFLMGSLSRKTIEKDRDVFSGAAYMFFIYLSMKVVIWLVRLVMGEGPSFSLLSDSGAPWIFFTFGIYLILGYLFKNFNKWFLLIASIAFALIAGYNTSIGDYLIASRTFIFFPFFLLGQMCDIERVSSFTGSRHVRFTGICVLILTLLAMIIFRKQLYILRPMFTGRNAYKSLGEGVRIKWLYRLAAYVVSTVLSLAVLAVTPRRNIGKWFSRIGEYFLPVYFWYRPLLYVLSGLNVFERLVFYLGHRGGRVVWVLLGCITVYVLANKWIRKLFVFAIDGTYSSQENVLEVDKSVKVTKGNNGIQSIYNWVEYGWNHSSVKNKCLIYLGFYTLLFGLLWPIVFSSFTANNKSFLWYPDGVGLWCTDLTYISKNVRLAIKNLFNGEGWTFPVYDFAKGMVERDLRLEPIQLLAIFWPWDKIDKLYDILVVLRFYLAGLSFSVFGFYFKQKPVPILTGAISYIFCQYAFFAGPRHPFFMQAMIYLPILIIGIEKVMKKEQPFLLIGIVFLVLSSNVYWACIQAILACIYVFVRFPFLYKKNRFSEFGHMMGRLTLSVGLAFLLSGAMFIAPLLQNLRSGRVGNNEILQYSNLFSYGKEYYAKFISFFIVDGTGTGAWVCLGYSVLVLPAIAVLFVGKKKEYSTQRIMFLILTAMLMIPIAAYVMSGFNALTNRWCLAYAFCVNAILMFQLPVLAESDKKTFIYVLFVVLAYCFVCRIIIEEKYHRDYVIEFLTIVMIVLALFRCINGQSKKLIMPLYLFITCLSVILTAHDVYDKNRVGYVNEFNKLGEFYRTLEQSPYGSFHKSNVMKEDNSFYRVDQYQFSQRYPNAAFYYGINGVDGWNQWYYKSYDDWIRELELAQVSVFGAYHGTDARTALQSLDSIKYYVMREENGCAVPYGFKEIERVKSGKDQDVILENQYNLPLGYTYDSYILKSEYNVLNSIEKQESQLQSVALENSPKLTSLKKGSPKLTANQIDTFVSGFKDVEWENRKLKVLKDNGTVTLSFRGLPETETYLRVVNFDLTSGSSTRNSWLYVSSGETSASGRFYADANIYSNGMKNQLLNLGYTEDGYTSCVITFPQKGNYILDDLQIWCQPMYDFPEQIDALRKEALENIEINRRGLTGTISLSKDKILCVSVPYSEGWTAYVDGEKADILQVNTAFMGLELTAGNHTIEFRYHVPGMAAGKILSVVGILALIWFVICWKRKPLWVEEWSTSVKGGEC